MTTRLTAQFVAPLLFLLTAVSLQSATAQAIDLSTLDFISQRTYDGSNNNLANPAWGQTNTPYLRVIDPVYSDGVGEMTTGPNSRYISNRIFQDLFVNVPDEHRVNQFGFVWGQFMDHTFGLAQDGSEAAYIAFDASDPLENFTNDLGVIPFARDEPVAGTGVAGLPRQYTNTASSYIDGWSIYGPDRLVDGIARVDRLRDPTNTAKLLVRTVRWRGFSCH